MTARNTISGSLSEAFVSIQGEGLRVGRRELFVRLAGCFRDCPWCDTPGARSVPPSFSLRVGPSPREIPNPVAPRALARLLAPAGPRTICVTGGEPFAQVPFLCAWLPLEKARGRHIAIETGGPRPGDAGAVEAATLADEVVLCAKPGAPGFSWDECAAFARGIRDRVTLKVVVLDAVPRAEYARAIELAASLARPLVFQPVTPAGSVLFPPDPALLLDLIASADDAGADARVIPQIHRVLHVP